MNEAFKEQPAPFEKRREDRGFFVEEWKQREVLRESRAAIDAPRTKAWGMTELEFERWKIEFSVGKSMRYHSYRRQFWERFDQRTRILVLIGGTAVFRDGGGWRGSPRRIRHRARLRRQDPASSRSLPQFLQPRERDRRESAPYRRRNRSVARAMSGARDGSAGPDRLARQALLGRRSGRAGGRAEVELAPSRLEARALPMGGLVDVNEKHPAGLLRPGAYSQSNQFGLYEIRQTALPTSSATNRLPSFACANPTGLPMTPAGAWPVVQKPSVKLS